MTKEDFARMKITVSIPPIIFVGLSDNIQIDPSAPIEIKDAHNVLTVVCNYFKVDIEQVKGKIRKRELVIPRQICMYILSKYSRMSLKRIGHIFSRDHSTCIYARDTVLDLMDTDKSFRRHVADCVAGICLKLPYLYYQPKLENNGN